MAEDREVDQVATIASLETDFDGFKDQVKRERDEDRELRVRESQTLNNQISALFRKIDELASKVEARDRISWPLVVSLFVALLGLAGLGLTFSTVMTRLNLAPIESKFDLLEVKARAAEQIQNMHNHRQDREIHLLIQAAGGPPPPPWTLYPETHDR